MEGKISFSGSAPGPTDPLCTELTAYIKVSEQYVCVTVYGNLTAEPKSFLFTSK